MIGGEVRSDGPHQVFIAAKGSPTPKDQAASLAIGSLSLGSATGLEVRAGWDLASVTVTNPDASIGSVIVGVEWHSGTILAGVNFDATAIEPDDITSPNGGNPEIVSAISRIAIGRAAYGTMGGDDRFVFAAERVLSVIVDRMRVPLTGGTASLGITGDFKVRSIS